MKTKQIKTLTLSIEETVALTKVTDPELIDAIVEALTTNAANPDAIDVDRYLDEDPIILNLVWKIYRRAEQARDRARRAEEKRKAREEAAKAKEEALQPNAHRAFVPLTPRNLNAIKCVRSSFPATFRQLDELFSSIKDSPAVEEILNYIHMIQLYLKPHLELFFHTYDNYYKMDRSKRPDHFYIDFAR